MVSPSVGERVRESVDSVQEGRKKLHNFNLHDFNSPHLKWGCQRSLRCLKVDSTAGLSSIEEHRLRSPPSGSENCSAGECSGVSENQSGRLGMESEKQVKASEAVASGEEGVEVVRENIIIDQKTAADKMKDAISREEVSGNGEEKKETHTEVSPPTGEEDRPWNLGNGEEKKEAHTEGSPPTGEEDRPWNLRSRKASSKAPVCTGSKVGALEGLKSGEKKEGCSPMRSEGAKRTKRLRRATEKTKKLKFSLSLQRKEIEEDFLEMMGHKPKRKPQKRRRTIQKKLDDLFPGLWLTEISLDLYKVPELQEN